jgi:hypothetical protein
MELFYYSVYGIMGLFLLAILIMVIKTTIEIKKSEKGNTKSVGNGKE